MPSEALASDLCAALAHEIRDLQTLIESLASVLISDEQFALAYLEQLQAFDLLTQRVQESADLLDRIASGMRAPDALAHVRLERMQERLRAKLEAA